MCTELGDLIFRLLRYSLLECKVERSMYLVIGRNINVSSLVSNTPLDVGGVGVQ